MIRNLTLTFALALLLAACGGDHGHDHGPGGHDHGPAEAPDHEAEGHDHAAEGHDHGSEGHDHAPAGTATAAGEVELQLGTWSARLHASESMLRLTVLGADGAAVTPVGDAKVVLTPTGGAEQRVTLKPEGEAWTGAAKAAGAPGYVAVVSVELDGQLQSGRVTWGEVPEMAPAATPEPDDHGHDHGSGDHGHAH